ncbi:hypothetical protein CU098_009508 [Rhizopus stolonifer]|uniref:Endoplasmic reticulum junction formation protein lunapark n=1 Tax=Rhizopus stolonifer TaxID=4846 RepID=A0A367JMD5_RHIST|nr:hypothetical protein CU098_009508 [Rhizopus stolonifer]
MGVLFSKAKTDSNDFEKILSELNDKIQKAEIKLSEIQIRQRRTSFMWIIYTLVVWIVCVVYLFKKINGPTTTSQEYLATLAPVIMLPVGIYYIRKGMIHFYEAKQKKEENVLSLLRKEQKEKVEELKKKTSYYSTQSLIERYDEEALKKKKEDELRQRKPVSMPLNNPKQPTSPIPNRPLQRNSPPNHSSSQQLQPQKLQTQQPMVPQARSEPQWYDKLVDALVGDAGPETKYALICTHCFAHNGLVLKEEHETIQYVCPVCKQFNPSRQSKQALSKAILEEQVKKEDKKEDEVEKEK